MSEGNAWTQGWLALGVTKNLNEGCAIHTPRLCPQLQGTGVVLSTLPVPSIIQHSTPIVADPHSTDEETEAQR